jgi:hypothetical protein
MVTSLSANRISSISIKDDPVVSFISQTSEKWQVIHRLCVTLIIQCLSNAVVSGPSPNGELQRLVEYIYTYSTHDLVIFLSPS